MESNAERRTHSWSKDRTANWLVLTALTSLLAAWAHIFGKFFPNAHGRLGHDYAYFLPNLFDGFIWSRSNGLGAVPWFTPSFFGGGIGAHVNVQRSYYSVPQLLVTFLDPVTTVWVTVVLFAALGTCATYVLLRRAFVTTRPCAVLGAGLFLFNGFYASRMIVGHFGYRGFMTLPLLAYLQLRELPADPRQRRWHLARDVVFGGLILADIAMSDFVSILPAGLLSVVAVAQIHALRHGRARDFYSRFWGAGVLGLMLSASKLTAVAYFMSNFPRSQYPLAGAPSVMTSLGLALRSLFISTAFDAKRGALLENLHLWMGRHEWEYSIGLGALAAVVWCAIHRFRAGWRPVRPELGRVRAPLVLLVAILCVPVLVNTYDPRWEQILRSTPLLGGTSTLFRWFSLYLLPACVAIPLLVDSCLETARHRRVVVLLVLFAVVAEKGLRERKYYHDQNYDPKMVQAAYASVRAGKAVPVVSEVLDRVHARTSPFRSKPNEAFLIGQSAARCADAVFGYKLELLPKRGLDQGSILKVIDAHLNFVNPSTYVWPGVNGGKPGTRFRADQVDQAVRLATYRPFDFEMPLPQRVANWVNLITLAGVVMFVALRLTHSFDHETSKLPRPTTIAEPPTS